MPIATTGEQRALRDSVDAAKGEWADLVRVGFFEVTREGGAWILNPGSPTERRRAPWHSYAELAIGPADLLEARIVRL